MQPVPGRWGGDEFLAIVRNVDKDGLARVAERCVMLIGQISVPSNDERAITVSISAGAALCAPGETGDELIQRADKLMYKSKAYRRGRATME